MNVLLSISLSHPFSCSDVLCVKGIREEVHCPTSETAGGCTQDQDGD